MRNSFIFILFFYIHSVCSGQDYLLDIQNITAQDGLANMHTTTAFRDSKGFLWVSTKYGLNRYDGYEFKIYTTEQNNLFSNSQIKRIEEDQDGNLWLFYLDNGGAFEFQAIDIFNPNTGKAIPVQDYYGELPFNLQEVHITRGEDCSRRFWIYDSQGQVYFYKDRTFQKFYEYPGKQILVVKETDNGIFVGAENELLYLDKNGRLLKKEAFPHSVEKIWPTDSALWVLTQKRTYLDSVVFMYDYTVWKKPNGDSKFRVFEFEKNNLLKNTRGSFLHRAKSGLWYFDCENYYERIPRILVFDPSGKEVFNLKKELETDIALQATGLMETDEHVWMSSSTGLLKVKITKNPFQTVHTIKGLSDSRGITEDALGNIYFLNREIYQYRPYSNRVKKISTHTGAFCLIYQDSSLHAAIYSANTKFLKFNLKQGKESYSNSWGRYSYVFCAHKTSDEHIYLLGSLKGLSQYDFRIGQGSAFQKYNEFEELKNYSIYHFLEDKEGIWLATENGIYLLKKDIGIVRRFNIASGDLPFNHIKHLSENPSGGFWLATAGGGIIHWTPSLDSNAPSKFRHFTVQDGLSNNFTYAVYPDEYGSLWIPSDMGLMQMSTSDFSVKTYLTEDGLPHNEFNTISHYRASDGSLYFGGLGGLIRFHPKDFETKKVFDVPVHFTGFHLWEDGKEKMTDKLKTLHSDELIKIHPGDKLFELNFALLDFDKAKNHRYSYKIEGYDDRPHLIKENFIRITNLPYGEYKLKIKGQNLTKGFSNEELSIPIHVLKPFYLQWWFIAMMIAASISFVFASFARRERRLRKERERLETEVKNRTQTIAKQTEDLKKLDKAKTRFFSNITHEFRTPLTLILGPTQLLAQNDKVSAPIRKTLRGISKNAEHLLLLVNQMLDISKIEGGQMRVEVSNGEIVSFIKELLDQFTPLADVKQQKLNFSTSESKWDTSFDKDKLNKILFNLLSNALKFTGSGGVVSLSLGKGINESIEITVEDNGVGIKPEQLDFIFDRFYQTDGTTTRSNEGTGIGLSLVKELVELLGGRIEVFSTFGEGTQFKIFLPNLEVSKEQTHVRSKVVIPLLPIPEPLSENIVLQQEKDQSIAEDTEKLDLLVVEDNEGIHEYIRNCIDADKYNILTALDGEDGIQKALQFIPDLIISDIMMPKKDGYDVLSTIRNHELTSHIPLILLTAKSSLESKLKGLRRGADAYLTKPFSPRELALRIEKLIEVRQKLQNRYQGGVAITKEEEFEKEDVFVSKIRAFILENIEETSLNGDKIGKHFNISRMHLYRKLKALTNQSISELIKEIRLKKAMELLLDKNEDLNVTEVAYKTGFSSISYFSRVFKSTFGKAPSEV